jgi:hypothetical protein
MSKCPYRSYMPTAMQDNLRAAECETIDVISHQREVLAQFQTYTDIHVGYLQIIHLFDIRQVLERLLLSSETGLKIFAPL